MRTRRLTWAVLLSVTALLATACAGQTTTPTTPTTGQPVEGGIAAFAQPANTTANYIFPFMGTEYFSIIAINDFQCLMYRPRYWFGDGTKPVLNDRLSLATSRPSPTTTCIFGPIPGRTAARSTRPASRSGSI